MNKKPKIILSQEERDKIIENASRVHQIVEEISAKRKKSKLEFLRHPLSIVIISAILSYLLIPLFLKQQTNNAERVKAKYELIKEMSLYKGRVIAMAENVVYLHQKPITDDEQKEDTIKSFNAAYDEFNSNFIRIDYELKIIFENEYINKEFADIQKEIKELNDFLDLLHEIPTSKVSQEHAKRIDECKNKIIEVKDKANSLSELMVEGLR